MAAFDSGVASGDVTDTRAVIWTRAGQAGAFRAQLALDEAFTQIVREVDGVASPDADLTVSLDLDGLAPNTRYHYRFYPSGDPFATSPVGTFRTAPSAADAVPFRFVLSGDSDYGSGPFHVLSDAAAQAPDIFVFFGDTMYGDIPAGGLGIARTLDEYRAKYVQNRTDAGMREIMARASLLVGWDDHEVVNDYWGAPPGPNLTPERIAAGYQAFFEYMPIRDAGAPQDPFRTYRAVRYGALAEFFLLDGRQYREEPADEACGNDPDPFDLIFGGHSPNNDCLAALQAPRTYLGADQLAWVKTQLAASTAMYKFVVTNQPMSFMGLLPYDRWDGYDAERRELLEFIDANRIENVWLLATDVHMNAYNPDVTTYFRAHRPDYRLDNGIAIAEVVAGPIAAQTLRSAVLSEAGEMTGGLADIPSTANLLSLVFNSMMTRIARANEWAYWQPDRYAYAMIDVDADGVGVSFRGYDPARQGERSPPMDTLYDSVQSIAVPCWSVPGLAMLMLLWLAAVGLRGHRNPLIDMSLDRTGPHK